MKILVIGANGFLGRNLTKKCIESGWDVDCVYNKGKQFVPEKCITYHINDLEKIKISYDAVFLLSAFIPYDNFNVPDKRLLDVNIKIPLKVINKFKKSKIIFSSSASVYGTHNCVIFENSPFNNPNIYALSKLSGECILRFSPDFQIVRFSSLYGNGMNTATFIPKILKHAKENGKITLFGNGSRLQDYLYIKDAVGYLISTLSQKESGTYLGVFGKSYSNTEIAEIVTKYVSGCKIQYDEKEDNSPSFIYNNSATRKLLKFDPKYNLETGIGEIIKNG